MPNWCYNTLTITGKPKALNKMLKQVKVDKNEVDDFNEHQETIFSFNKVIPIPKSEKDNWYNWRVSNWGTKWNADVQYETTDQWENGEVLIEFNTAWAMPIPVLETLSKQHPTLTFFMKAYEESHAFWQIFTLKNGNYKEFDEGDFSTCAEFEPFDLTHHSCEICQEWLDEWCDNSNETEVICDECKAEIEQTEAQINEIEKELWKGEIDETTQKENAV